MMKVPMRFALSEQVITSLRMLFGISREGEM